MLAVGPERRTFPIALSLVVSTAKTVLALESKAATMFRVGDSAMRPGEPPALRGETRAIVSLVPSTKTKLPKLNVELTPCDTRTRFFSPLGTFFGLLLPQAMKLTLAHNPTMRTSMLLFKRLAPKDMKKGDLIAKCWIITDPESALTQSPSEQAQTPLPFFAHFAGVRQMHEAVLILYSQTIYGI
jgi:hypothetical protein